MYLALRLGSDLQIRIQRKWCSGTTTFFYIFQSQGQIQRGAIAPLKLTKLTFFTMILYNSESTIGDIRPIWVPLFCHSSVVKYTLRRLQ